MLLELWSAEALELKHRVVGGVMPVRCREVGQRPPESLSPRFYDVNSTSEEDREKSLSPQLRMIPFESNLHVFSSAAVTDVMKIRKGSERAALPRGGSWKLEPPLPWNERKEMEGEKKRTFFCTLTSHLIRYTCPTTR